MINTFSYPWDLVTILCPQKAVSKRFTPHGQNTGCLRWHAAEQHLRMVFAVNLSGQFYPTSLIDVSRRLPCLWLDWCITSTGGFLENEMHHAFGSLYWKDDIIEISPVTQRLFFLPKRWHYDIFIYFDTSGSVIDWLYEIMPKILFLQAQEAIKIIMINIFSYLWDPVTTLCPKKAVSKCFIPHGQNTGVYGDTRVNRTLRMFFAVNLSGQIWPTSLIDVSCRLPCTWIDWCTTSTGGFLENEMHHVFGSLYWKDDIIEISPMIQRLSFLSKDIMMYLYILTPLDRLSSDYMRYA